MTIFTESVVEEAALGWLDGAGWSLRQGAAIASGEPDAERDDYGQVVLVRRLRDALARINAALPAEALEDAFPKLTRPEGADLVACNRIVHRLLVDGVTVEYRLPALPTGQAGDQAGDAGGEIRGGQAKVIDFDRVEANDWLAVNQFSVADLPALPTGQAGGQAGNKHARRPDVVLFVNGLPLAVLELKNAASEEATIRSAFQRLQTYKAAAKFQEACK
jgi:type I restriction enzyme R subunit